MGIPHDYGNPHISTERFFLGGPTVQLLGSPGPRGSLSCVWPLQFSQGAGLWRTGRVVAHDLGDTAGHEGESCAKKNTMGLYILTVCIYIYIYYMYFICIYYVYIYIYYVYTITCHGICPLYPSYDPHPMIPPIKHAIIVINLCESSYTQSPLRTAIPHFFCCTPMLTIPVRKRSATLLRRKVLLPEPIVETFSAKCLDSSPAGYFIRHWAFLCDEASPGDADVTLLHLPGVSNWRCVHIDILTQCSYSSEYGYWNYYLWRWCRTCLGERDSYSRIPELTTVVRWGYKMDLANHEARSCWTFST